MIFDYKIIQEEYTKCLTDKSHIYMIENYLSTYDMRKRKKVPFILFPRQKDFLLALRDYQNNITTKPRQAGITTTTAAFMSCEIALADPNSPETILVIGNKLDLARQMVSKIKDFLKQIPRWFWGDDFFSPDPKSEKNKQDIFITQNKDELELFNGCKVIAKSSGTNAARGVSSVSWLIFDEAAFIENGIEVFSQAVATTSTGGHIIMISTPCGKDQLYYKTYDQARKRENGFHITELRWYQDPRYNKFLKWTKKNNETGEIDVIEEKIIDKDGSVEYNEEHWKKMEKNGYKATSPWYVNMCGKFNNNEQKIAQELDVSFLGSANNVVDPMYIEMQSTLNVMDPDPFLKDPFVEETWVWKQPIEDHRYIMSIDCSRGDAADSTAIEIIDIDAVDENGTPCFEQVLEYNGKRTGDEIGEIAYNYGKMYGEAFCIVDCIGGTGDACILTLMNLGYKNLYYDDATLKNYTAQYNATKLKSNEEGKLPGFHSSSVRFQMLSNFANLVKTNALKIRSKRVISELETWIFKGDQGRMDHMDGAHDDTITCLAMGMFVMMFSLQKIIAAKAKDIAIVKSWVSANKTRPVQRRDAFSTLLISPQGKRTYNKKEESIKREKKINGSCMWLLGKMC